MDLSDLLQKTLGSCEPETLSRISTAVMDASEGLSPLEVSMYLSLMIARLDPVDRLVCLAAIAMNGASYDVESRPPVQ